MRFLAAIIASAVGLTSPAVASEPSIFGVWIEPDMQAEVQVFPCGEAICGELIHLPDGSPRTDSNNPDPALRDRPLLGLRVLRDFRPAGPDLWEGGGRQGRLPGRLYVPANGDTLGDADNTYVILSLIHI